jgi:phosphonate transport system substrate-binding protein
MKITLVWYPNESAADYQPARDEIASLISEATGKKVEHKLTTDYSIAIESVASGTAQICFMGAQGYIEANKKTAPSSPCSSTPARPAPLTAPFTTAGSP